MKCGDIVPENNNGYNPDGIENIDPENVPVNEPSTSDSLVHMGQNAVNSGKNIAHGVQNARNRGNTNNDLAKGIDPSKKNNSNLPDKNSSDKNNLPGEKKDGDLPSNPEEGNSNNLNTKDNPNNQNSNLMPGQTKNNPANNDNNQNNNMMPGQKNDLNKKDDKNKPKVQDKKTPEKKPQNKKSGKKQGNKLNKKGASVPLMSRLNPINRLRNRSGSGAETEEEQSDDNRGVAASAALSLGDKIKVASKEGIMKVIAVIPVPIKIGILAGILLLFIILLIALFVSIAASSNSDNICENDESSGTAGTFSNVTAADTKDFLCKMQSPFGNKSYPVYGWVGEPRSGHTHAGVDLSLGCGTSIQAVQEGVVHSSGWEGGYGNSVVIKHMNGKFYTRYGHMSKRLVSKGDKVTKGQLIGKVGNTGNSYGCHLHFELREKSSYGTTVKAINDYFNASKATEHSRQNVSASFKKQCGSAWQGDPVGSSSSGADNSSTDTSIVSDCCVESESSSSTSSSNYCSNGITVAGKTVNFEEYIAGVVTAENSYKNGNNVEASKANAIAARTYAINRTNNCKKSIGNSQAAQVFKTPGAIGKKAANETAGQVMHYNGKVFSSEYDSFCGRGGTATYTKVPSSKTHSITLGSKFRGMIAGGHCRGMSQLYARQLQDEGKKYDEILKFFYADGIEITGAGSSTCSVGGDSFNGKIWAYYQYNYKHPYSGGTIASSGCGPTSMAMVVSSFLNAKHDPVELADFSTRNGTYVSGVGTAWNFFSKAGKKYGLKVKQLSKSNSNEVLTSLNSGKALVIAAMGPGTFTRGGHFILLTGVKNGKISIQDPASESRSKKTWGFKSPIVSQASQFWIITKG